MYIDLRLNFDNIYFIFWLLNKRQLKFRRKENKRKLKLRDIFIMAQPLFWWLGAENVTRIEFTKYDLKLDFNIKA